MNIIFSIKYVGGFFFLIKGILLKKILTIFLVVILVSAQCGLNTVKVQGYQPLTFRGEMYLKQSMFSCQLREMVSDIPGMRLFELEIPHRAITPCALTKTQNNEVY